MKHTLPITFILFGLFLAAHFVGLFVINNYAENEYPYGIEPPQVETTASFVEITVSIVLITILAFIIIKLRARNVWKFWFLLSLIVTMLLSFGSFLDHKIALIIAVLLGLWRVFKNNVYIFQRTLDRHRGKKNLVRFRSFRF